MASKTLLQSAARSASYNIILQISMRMLTFILNAFILRHVNKEVLGVINVRLMLLYTTVQFLSREAFRRACLSNVERHYWPTVINLVWLSVPVSVAIGAVMGVVWLGVLHQPDSTVIPGYTHGVLTVIACVILEMTAEPVYIVSQAFQFLRLKVFIEGFSVALRCVLMSFLIVFFSQTPIWVFSVSLTASSVFYTVVFYGYFYLKFKQDLLKDTIPVKNLGEFLPSSKQIDSRTAILTWSFMKQTFFKQVLTEGERYVMTLFNILSFAEQGVYDVVNNLGSLAARFIFQPIEESGYLFFAQVLQRDVEASHQKVDDVVLSSTVLENLLKLMALLGLTVVTFGQTYSQLLLHLYGGTLLSTGIGPTLLRWHCGYVLFLAINGVTECFTFAAMSKVQLDQHNQKMAVFSVIFLLASYFLTKFFGAVGFIMANCLNMAARILHSTHFIHNYYKISGYNPLGGMLPHRVVLMCFVVSYLVTSASESMLCCNKGIFFWLVHGVIGVFCLMIVLGCIMLKERGLIAFLNLYWQGRKSEKEDKLQ